MAFVSGTPNTPANVWVVDAKQGAPPRRLTRLGARPLAWAADGKSVYCQTMEGGASAFRVVDAQTGRARPALTFLPAGVTQVAFSEDHRRVAYLREHDSHRDLWVAGVGGTRPQRLSEGLRVRTVDWSPDGRRIVFDVGRLYGETTYVVETDGTKEPVAVYKGMGSAPSWSPDGSRFVVLGMHAATLVSKTGGNTRRLHISLASRRALDWSPDGKFLAYTTFRPEGLALAVVNVDSGKETLLWTALEVAISPRWSPSGHSIAIEAGAKGAYGGDLYLVDVHQRKRIRLTVARPSSWSVQWSGDGKWVFALSNATGGSIYGLCRGAADGSAFRRFLRLDPSKPVHLGWPRRSPRGVLVAGKEVLVVDGPREPKVVVTTEHPTWASLSPTGKSLAYIKWQNHQSSLVVSKPDGTSEKEVLPPPAAGQAYSHVAWSPQGDRIAFVRAGEVCTVGAEGGAVAVLFSPKQREGDAVVLTPRWSPDGLWLAFGRVLRTGGQRLEIRAVRRDGTRPKLLATRSFISEGGMSADPLASPYAWSPDGKWLALSEELDGTPAIYLSSLGADPPRLLKRAACCPSWTPDGKRVAYTSLRGPGETIRLLRPDGKGDRLMGLRPVREAPAKAKPASPGATKGKPRAK